MRLRIVAVGRLKAGPERDLVARYAARVSASGRTVGITRLDIDEIDESAARRAPDRRTDEARLISGKIGLSIVVALDERGRDLTSEAFAALLTRQASEGRDLTFLIGGPDGIEPELLAKASDRVRFGAMTLPHGLVRVLLVEQIYRAVTLLSGHPYHRGADHRDPE